MSLISLDFIYFAAVFFAVYYLVPKKIQWIVILCGNMVFYAFYGLDNLIIVLLTSLAAYSFSRAMQVNIKKQEEMTANLERKEARAVKESMKKSRKKLLVAALIIVIGVLAFLKYYNFFAGGINSLLGVETLPGLRLIAPLGISYYTFMLIAYLVDVYKAKTEAATNPARFMAYILYFPQITQGPISRYGEVAPQIFAYHSFDYDSFRKGLWLMIWGFFKKLVIADNIARYVTLIIEPYNDFHGTAFLLAALLFSIQIYCDFSGCMDIVRGCSECLGIVLPENFERPYFSRTMPEFWRRWHISLGAFFREYVFYPISTTKLFLQVNTKSRKLFGAEAGRVLASCLPIMCVWLLTGLWHGAATNFIGWGIYQGVIICISTAIENPAARLCEKLHIDRESFLWRLFQILRTFFLCLVGRIFFLGTSLSQSIYMLKSIIVYFGDFEYLKAFVYSPYLPYVLGLSIALLFACSLARERMKKNGSTETLRDWLLRRNFALRWAVLVAGIAVILLFGNYGTGAVSSFVYEQF